MGALSLCQEMSNGEAFILNQSNARFAGESMEMVIEEGDLELIAGWLTYPSFGRASCMTRYGNESSGVIDDISSLCRHTEPYIKWSCTLEYYCRCIGGRVDFHMKATSLILLSLRKRDGRASSRLENRWFHLSIANCQLHRSDPRKIRIYETAKTQASSTRSRSEIQTLSLPCAVSLLGKPPTTVLLPRHAAGLGPFHHFYTVHLSE